MSDHLYIPRATAKREVQFIGALPAGRWLMHSVPTSGAKWAIVLVDTTHVNAPRIVKDGVLSVLESTPEPSIAPGTVTFIKENDE